MTSRPGEPTHAELPSTTRQHLRLSLWSLLSGILVAVAWFLVAVPGTDAGGGGVGHYAREKTRVHGWPAVWLATQAIEVDAAAFPQLPPDSREFLQQWRKDNQADFLQTDFARYIWVDQWEFPADEYFTRFWSCPDNWRVFGPGILRKWIPAGLLINLILACVSVWLVVALTERRLRRDRRFLQFSIRRTLLALLAGGATFGVLLSEYRASISDRELDSALKGSPFALGEWRSRLPGFLVRLMDGKLLFSRATSVTVDREWVDWRAGNGVEGVASPFELDTWQLNRLLAMKTLTEWRIDGSFIRLATSLEVPQAKSLGISWESATANSDWTWLESFPNVKSITFDFVDDPDSESHVNLDGAVEHLKRLRKLRHIWLCSGCDIDPRLWAEELDSVESIEVASDEMMQIVQERLGPGNPALHEKFASPEW